MLSIVDFTRIQIGPDWTVSKLLEVALTLNSSLLLMSSDEKLLLLGDGLLNGEARWKLEEVTTEICRLRIVLKATAAEDIAGEWRELDGVAQAKKQGPTCYGTMWQAGKLEATEKRLEQSVAIDAERLERASLLAKNASDALSCCSNPA